MKKIFTLIAALAATALVSSAETVEYVVKNTSDGKMTAGQVISTAGDPIKVTSIYAASANKNMKDNLTFTDETPSKFFGAKSTAFRLDKAPNADNFNGTEKSGSTAFILEVSETIKEFKFYFEASKGTRSIGLFSHSTGTSVSIQGKSTDVDITTGTQRGFISTFSDIEPGSYTIYATGYGAGYCGIKYYVERADDLRSNAEISYDVDKFEYCTNDGEFTLPVLNNPNNLEGIVYSSSDDAVATVNEAGVVTIVGDGTAKITATYEGNDDFEPATVSYTLNVYTKHYLVAFGVEGEHNYGVNVDGTTTMNDTQIAFANGWGSGNYNYAMLTTNGGFKGGDVITVKGNINNKGTDKYGAVHISLGYGHTIYSSENFNNKNANGLAGVIDEFSYTLEYDTDVLYLHRNGNTGTNLTYILVERDENYVGYEAPEHNLDGVEANAITLATGTEITFTHSDANAKIFYAWEKTYVQEVATETETEPAAAPKRVPAVEGYTELTTESPIVFNAATKGDIHTLYYYAQNGDQKSAIRTLAVTHSGDEVTGIEAVAVDANEGAVEYFNLQGIRVANPSNGIFILRQGKNVSKVLVK